MRAWYAPFVTVLALAAATGCGASSNRAVENDGSTGNGRGDGSISNDGSGGDGASRDAGPVTPGNGGTLTPRSTARVFYSGHSLLTTPDMIDSIAANGGDDLEWNQQNIPGSPIRVRTCGDGCTSTPPTWPGYSQGQNRTGQGMNVVEELRDPSTLGANERYDTLLITERNDPLNTIIWENTIAYLRHFHDRLIEGNPNAHTIFYQVWPAMAPNAPDPWIAYVKKELTLFECIASKVNLTLEQAGRSDRLSVLPGGYALAVLMEQVLAGQVRGIDGSESERIGAILSDDVHLAPIGHYFMAIVHYAALFGKSPVGAWAPADISAETAADLQNIAWSVLSEYHSTERPWQHTMEHCRRVIAEDVCPAHFRDFAPNDDRLRQCPWFEDNAHEADHPLRWPHPDYAPPPAP